MFEPRKIGMVPPLQIEVGHDVVLRLRPAARPRGVNVKTLVHDLLDAIAADGLTDAVLDDADAEP